jgi:dUTP pyrophosphatase
MSFTVTNGGKLPIRATAGAAGYDLFSNEVVNIEPLSYKMIDTGVQVKLPDGYCGKIEMRSGLALRHGLMVMAGVIDSDYTGIIKVLVFNAGDKPYTINLGDRFAQMLVLNVSYQLDYIQENDQKNAQKNELRLDNGFGSTGL